MSPAQPGTPSNLEAAFGGESMANRKYLFFAQVAKQLGNSELASLFRDTANQETEHAFAHFRLLHPELVIDDPAALSPAEKQQKLARCLELAIEGETYEYTTMYPDFAAQARADRDTEAAAGFEEQRSPEDLVAAGADPALADRVQGLLRRAEFKRRQAAPLLKVSGRAFGSGWRMPIAAAG